MSYAPINTKVFTAAYAGAIAGMAVSGWITDPTSADYSNATIIAGAFAQSFDTIWNDSAALNSLELAAITAIVQTDFNGRGPGPFNSPTYQSPNNWNSAAAACIALVLECDIYFAGQGITPPTPGGIPITALDAVQINASANANFLIPIPPNDSVVVTVVICAN